MAIAAAEDGGQSGTGASSHRVKFIVAWAAMLAVKLTLAMSMPLFGDEAFYAWEALHPAWAYSDLPGATAASIGLGTALFGSSFFGVRAAVLVLGAALPWLVVRLAARLGPAEDAWRAGLWSLPLPLLLPMGFMALPDALLTFAAMVTIDACAGLLARPHDAGASPKAAGAGESGLYLQLALGLALGALTHYRFAPLLVVGAAAFFAVGGGRYLRDPRFGMALLVGALAWWPVLAYNLGADAAGLRFHVVERHPWDFDAKGLAQPLLQAIISTPLLYVLLLWAAGRSVGRAVCPLLRFLALCVIGLCLFYALLAPFVDRARFSLHWPIPAYLVAAALLPDALRKAAKAWPRRLAPWAAGLAATGWLAMAAVFTLPAVPALGARTAGTALYPDNFLGWTEVAQALRPRLGTGDAIVADHFMLAAQLSFALDRRPDILVLDHWNNHKHGRAAQLAAWGYDEAGIDALAPGKTAWIAFEVAETPERDREAWVGRLCRWFEDVRFVETIDGPGGGKRFWLYRGIRGPSEAASHCMALPPQA